MYRVLRLRIILTIIFLPHLIFLPFVTVREVSSNRLHLMSLSIQVYFCVTEDPLAFRTGAQILGDGPERILQAWK
jgi:hypothetical protein